MKKTLLSLVAVLAIAGCAKNEIEAPVTELGFVPEDVVITLEDGEATKTSLSGGSVIWHASDEITLLYKGTSYALTYKLKSGDGTTQGTFTYSGDYFDTHSEQGPFDKFYGIYPAIAEGEYTPMVSSGKLQVTIPSTQNYTAASFGYDTAGNGVAVMTGYSETVSGINFNNATGLLKIFMTPKVANMPPLYSVTSITISSQSGKAIAGPAEIDANNAAVLTTGGSSSITLNCSESVLNNSETYYHKGTEQTLYGNAFIFAMPPTPATPADGDNDVLTISIVIKGPHGETTMVREIPFGTKAGGFAVKRSKISTVAIGYDMEDLNIEAGIETVAAEIGNNRYYTLADAVDAAESGETITLARGVGENIVIPEGKEITIDINKQNIIGGSLAGKAAITNKGTLTLINGFISRNHDEGSYYIIENEGTLILGEEGELATGHEELEVKGSGSSSLIRNNAAGAVMTINRGTFTQTGAFVVLKNDLGTVNVKGGTFTTQLDKAVLNNWATMNITGGTFNGQILNGAYDTEGNTLTISDGEFNSSKIRTYLGNGKTSAPIVITGGEFTNASMQFTAEGTATANQSSITGGTFAVNPATYVDPDYRAVKVADKWNIELRPVIATIGSTEYRSLVRAFAAATSGQIITLLADAENAGNLSLKAGVTLDGDNHTISGDSAVHVATAGAAIKNVNFENIHNAENGQNAVVASGITGAVTITGCTFDNVDWDAVQIVPSKDAADDLAITIKDNIFKHTNTAATQQRYVHVEYVQGASNVGRVTALFNITDNQFLDQNQSENTITAILIAYVEGKDDSVLSGNYYSNREAIEPHMCFNITIEDFYPMRSQADVDVDDIQIETAMIGSTKYATLAAAFEAANATTSGVGVTIKLLRDVVVNETYTVNNTSGKWIALDLNGHNLTAEVPVVNAYTQFNYQNTGKDALTTVPADGNLFTIQDGVKLLFASGIFNSNSVEKYLDKAAYFLKDLGNGTYQIKAWTDAEALAAGYLMTANISNKACYFKTLKDAVDYAKANAKTSVSPKLLADVTSAEEVETTLTTLTINPNGYTFTGAVNSTGTVALSTTSTTGTVNFTKLIAAKLANNKSTAAIIIEDGNVAELTTGTGVTPNLTITGGTYGFDPLAYVDSENYTVAENLDGTWTVSAK